MSKDSVTATRTRRVRSHLRHNAVAYAALVVAVSMTPLPSQAADLMIGTNDIRNGAVTTKKLHANAVKSGKIAVGAVRKSDLAPAAQGFTRVVTKLVTVPNVAAGGVSTQTIDCGAGKVAVGGGGYAVSTEQLPVGVTKGELVLSHPVSGPTTWHSIVYYYGSEDNAAPVGWRTSVRNDQANPTTIQHYAMCASK